MNSLTFGNYNDSTTNGSDLSSFNFGLGLFGGNNTPNAQPQNHLNVNPSGVAIPQVPGVSGTNPNGNSFWNLEGGAGLALGGVKVLGNLWNSYQQQKIAKDQLSFAKNMFNKNLTNQTKTYNSALEDRIRSRHAYSGKSEEDTQNYLKANRL
jgi:hypothetical protein